MRVKEAKDFLVRQTEIQAAIDGVPLSEQEKKLMYFTESNEEESEATEVDSFEVNDEDCEYEKKISSFCMAHTAELKKRTPEERRQWDEAMRTLREGDRYLPVLWKPTPSERIITAGFCKLLAVGICCTHYCNDRLYDFPAQPRLKTSALLGNTCPSSTYSLGTDDWMVFKRIFSTLLEQGVFVDSSFVAQNKQPSG